MSAILELKETPKSCKDCPINFEDSGLEVSYCAKTGFAIDDYTVTRHPDCPLKITEDNLRWILLKGDLKFKYCCPECKQTESSPYKYCRDCGIKILPPS